MPSSAQRSRSELHWGVIGLGNIANDFVLAMAYCRHPNKVVAVSTSDSVERAHKFKQSVGLNSEEIKAYGNYEDLLRDPDVDIVYIATINSTHLPIIISALEHGKSVLCEKPMVLSSAEVSTVQMVQKTINQKEGRKLFVMEGFWSCLFPSWQKIREVVRNGQMGDPKVVMVDFSQELPNKRRDLSIGVCPLMDIGCYSAVGEKDEKGGGHAICYYNGLISTNSTASVTLEMGNLELPERFWASTELRSREELQPNRRIEWQSEHFPFPESKGLFGLENPGDFVFHNSCGLNYEADHVWECIEKERTESDVMGLDESLKIASILERAREQIGVEIEIQSQVDLSKYQNKYSMKTVCFFT
uniref:Trans-1,2-dihydrobenzene-1,2-diol dehydrogenase n=1 Tax=Globodera rostochiensis TaxID=31243 RepID=A0A914ID94_GLORO